MLEKGIPPSDLVKMAALSKKPALAAYFSFDHGEKPLSRETFTSVEAGLAAWCKEHAINTCLAGSRGLLAIAPFEKSREMRYVSELRDLFGAAAPAAIHVEFFHLPGDAEKFQRQLEGESALVPIRAGDDEGLSLMKRVYAELAQADLSNFIRESAIFIFAKDGGSRRIATELTIDMGGLSQAVGVPLDRNPWLVGAMTRAVDERMLAHLVAEASHRVEGYGLNLHVGTPLSEAFAKFLGKFATLAHGRMSVDFDYHEWRSQPEVAERSAKHLADAGFSTCLDAIPADQIGQFEVPLWVNGFLKVDAGTTKAEQFGDLYQRRGPWDAARIVLLHCHDKHAITAARTAGFALLEGPEVAAFAHYGLTSPRRHKPGATHKKSVWRALLAYFGVR